MLLLLLYLLLPVSDSMLPLLSLLLQIVWENRYRGNHGDDCLVSVDCTDAKCPNFGPAFSTYKHDKKGGLRYKLCISIQTGELMWINGPYPTGHFNDITIF